MPLRKYLFSLLAALCVAALPSWSATADPNSKIASRVMSETANGGSTEALVVLTRQADLSAAYNLPTKAMKGSFVVNTLRSVADATQGPILAMLQQRGIPYQSFWIVNMIKVTGDRSLMEALAQREDVARLDANPHVHTALPNPNGGQDGFQAQGVEWNIQRVKAPDVWALGFRGEGRVVAGADTGVSWTHIAIKNQYRGWNGQQANHDYNWHDATGVHLLEPNDDNGHGTFTLSEMVGDDGRGNQIGIAPGAKWIACQNMDAGGNGQPAWYTDCFQFLIAPYPIGGGQGDPSKAPDSINNSWVCPPSEGCDFSTLQAIVDAVRAAGIFPSMAAGNDGPACSTIMYPPAIYDSVMTVGATDSNNHIADFSSRGPVLVDGSHRVKPDVTAPGVSVRAAFPGNGYGLLSGTSMAAPHVAGGVALLWQAKPNLVGDITASESAMEHSAQHLTSVQATGYCRGPNVFKDNTFGWGLLNLLGAVQSQQ